MSYTYGPGASLTGPCLVNSCSGKTSQSTFCGASVQLCAAGSNAFSNPVDASDVGEKCSYNYTDGSSVGSCNFLPLGGKLGGSGNSWSLYDSATTVQLTPTVVPENGGGSITILYVSSTSSLSHFITEGAAAASSATASTSSSTTSTSATSTTSSAIIYPNSTSTYNATTVAPSTSGPVVVGTGVTATTVTTGNITPTGSASPSSTATLKGGVERMSAPNMWKSIAIGALVLAACVV